ncbi:MAG: hypothetical protein K5857_01695 [Lachnospiraceae bacterium]|nr:hypothetical protein [Lachnospiraceae bacterium]
MEKDNVINDLYKDIVKKRNKWKIDLDNYITEIEILKRSIEYNSSREDDSRFFSPRSNDKSFESTDELSTKMESYEKLVEETKDQFNYYDTYCTRLALLIKSDKDKEDDNEEEISYSLNLNYDVEGIKEKLESVMNSLDLCLKIFDNDRNRTREELKNLKRNIEGILETMD